MHQADVRGRAAELELEEGAGLGVGQVGGGELDGQLGVAGKFAAVKAEDGAALVHHLQPQEVM